MLIKITNSLTGNEDMWINIDNVTYIDDGEYEGKMPMDDNGDVVSLTEVHFTDGSKVEVAVDELKKSLDDIKS